MNMISPERVQCMKSGVRYSVWLASRAPASAARGPGDDEGGELVAERREADGPRAGLVRPGRADHHAEARVDEPVAERAGAGRGSPARRSRRSPAREVDRSAEPAARGQAHAVVAAVGLEADAQVVEHLGEGQRDHDEVHAAGPERDRADHQRHQRRRPRWPGPTGRSRSRSRGRRECRPRRRRCRGRPRGRSSPCRRSPGSGRGSPRRWRRSSCAGRGRRRTAGW